MEQINVAAAKSNKMVYFIATMGEMVAKELDLPAAPRLRGGLLLDSDLSPGFSFCREPSRALEPGQCHQPDIVVQTIHARLQRGGIMQHHQRLPGHRRAPFRDAGVHAAARGVLG